MAVVLVTGGSGFIGRRVVRAVTAAGQRVRVLDLVAPQHVPDGVELIIGDIRDPEVIREALAGADAVSHHAATVGMGVDLSDLPRYVSNNDLGTATLLAGMHEAGVRALVLASSMVAYGEGAYTCPDHGAVAAAPRRESELSEGLFEPPCPICGGPLAPGRVLEDAALDPRSVYAATKVAQEHLVKAWARESPGCAALLRYHNVYGPGLPRDTPYAGVAAIFLSALLADRSPEVYEDGLQRRDFVHVDDVAAANVAALDAVLAGDRPGLSAGTARAYNVATGVPRTVLDLAAELARAVQGPAPRVSGRYRAGDIRHVTASSDRIQHELGWAPAVPFDAGVAELAREFTTASAAGVPAATR